jgi:uncharacterized protein (TIGR00255 family)
MLQSMTGFGKSNGVFESKKVSIEIRSLNSKGLDLNVKIPSTYRELETDIRKIVVENLDRGKVDLGIYIESATNTSNDLINHELATKYYHELKSINEQWGEKPVDFLALVLKMPEVLNQQAHELSEVEKVFLLDLMKAACIKLHDFRKTEGQALELEFTTRIEEIRSLLNRVADYEQERIVTVKDRLSKALKDLETKSLDDNRLEQEMIFYIEKLDVSEEKMRLANHLDYFLETMVTPLSGKKLGFIAQEIGREINTLGSKSNHAEMQKIVVEMKDKLEKIKEQVLNTL